MAPTNDVLFTPPQFLNVRDVRTAYRRLGSGAPVLYLHGIGMTKRWLPFHAALAERADVIAPEHPGFGDTPRPERIDGWLDVVLHYDEVLTALDLERVHVVGYDLGGWLAAELAVVYPQRVRSLTLIAPMGIRVAGSPVPDRFRLNPERLAAATFNDDPEPYRAHFEDPDRDETFFASYAESTMAALLTWTPRYDVKLDSRLARVTSPALVIAAQHDRLVSEAHAARYASLLPAAQLMTIAGASHGLIAESPVEVAGHVHAHIEATDTA